MLHLLQIRYDANTVTFNFYVKPVMKEVEEDTTPTEETPAAGVTIEEDKAPLASNGVQSSINNSNSTSSSLSVVTVAIVAFAVLIILLVAGVLAMQAKKRR